MNNNEAVKQCKHMQAKQTSPMPTSPRAHEASCVPAFSAERERSRKPKHKNR